MKRLAKRPIGVGIIESTTRFSYGRKEFLSSLRQDLVRAGSHASLVVRPSRIRFRASLQRPQAHETRSRLYEIALRRLRENREFIADVLERGEIQLKFVAGADVNVDAIAPVVQVCQNEQDFALFRLCCLMQTVPTPHLSFRRMIFLVRDSGHPNTPLIGVFALSSPGYSIACRDNFLDWKQGVALRQMFLNSCMQLSVCMAVPPYSYIRAGRLISACVFNNAVAEEFERRYRDGPLLAVTTTAAAGLHAPIFNRIMLRPGGVYKRIGVTAGYSTVHFGAHTIQAAKRLVVANDGADPRTVNHPIRLMKRALNLCGLKREPFVQLGETKGVYLGTADQCAIEILRGKKTCCPIRSFTTDEIVGWWNRDLQKAVRRSDLVSKFRAFTPSDLASILEGSNLG